MKPCTSLIRERRRFPHLAVMILILTGMGLSSLNAQQKPTRQSSIDAFSRGDYELAYSGFSELLVTFPKDPLYKYYSGVCLVKLNRDPGEALLQLKQAQQGSAVVRSVPSDALFWLGRAQQMTGRFDEAISSYNAFTEQYGKKIARDLDIPSFLQQCHERKGQLTESASLPLADEKQVQISDKPVIEAAEPEYYGATITKKTQDSIPGNFDLILAKAIEYQYKADSLYKITEEWKTSLDKLDYKAKTELRTKITETEGRAAKFQKEADLKYNEAQVSMNSTSFSAIKIDGQETVPKADSSAHKAEPADTSKLRIAEPLKKDTAVIKKDTARAETYAKKIEESVRRDSTAITAVKEEAKPSKVRSIESFSLFEVKPSEAGSTDKIPFNKAIPPGLIYRIQTAVFRNPVAMSYFKGITPVYGFKTAGNDYTTYYAGLFRRIADARKALLTVKQKGFKDAFIVAFSGGKRVSLERAAVLEKEWSKKPFNVLTKSMTPADTIPPELCFRVEVTRSAKPVNQDVLQGIKNIAGTRGFDTESSADGSTVYLIGKFITYDSALSYADLLIRNGYHDSRVVARLGKKEVPVETARTLFEQIE
ncbi:MAG: tetratricopeptide repeat protein [Bacteroidia bacterium]|nr:tetratricopeptide repeat protein [Bacteroidia bacterium]